MSTRTRNLTVAGTAMIVVVLFLFRTQPSAGDGVAASLPEPAASRSAPVLAAAPSPTPSASERQPGAMVTHAVDVGRLNGFPPDASSGDVFDIWVAWNPPVVKGPNVQLLLKGVTLEKIAPPVTPDGPYVAFLLVDRSQARDLLYGTKYGLLSVTQPAS